MLPTKTRMMTGTRGRKVSDDGSGAMEGGMLTVRATHSPGEAAADCKSDVMVLAHPAAGHGKQAREDAADNLGST